VTNFDAHKDCDVWVTTNSKVLRATFGFIRNATDKAWAKCLLEDRAPVANFVGEHLMHPPQVPLPRQGNEEDEATDERKQRRVQRR